MALIEDRAERVEDEIDYESVDSGTIYHAFKKAAAQSPQTADFTPLTDAGLMVVMDITHKPYLHRLGSIFGQLFHSKPGLQTVFGVGGSIVKASLFKEEDSIYAGLTFNADVIEQIAIDKSMSLRDAGDSLISESGIQGICAAVGIKYLIAASGKWVDCSQARPIQSAPAPLAIR